jgi:hypothetical protein
MNAIGVTHTNLYECASRNEGGIVDAKVNPSLLDTSQQQEVGARCIVKMYL